MKLRFVLVLLPLLAIAGGKPRREVVVGGATFPQSIVVLVDTSASMGRDDGAGYRLALREARWITREATDAGRLRFGCFDTSVDWDTQGWIAQPDAEKVAIAHAWLSQHGTGGATDLVHAVDQALELEEGPLGVVMITDGDPDGASEWEARQIVEHNAKRKEPAVIGVIAVDPDRGKEDRVGVIVAEGAGGAYVRTTSPKEQR